MRRVSFLLLTGTVLSSAATAQKTQSVEGLVRNDGTVRACGREFNRGKAAELVASLKFCDGDLRVPRASVEPGALLVKFKVSGSTQMPGPGVGGTPPPLPPPPPKPTGLEGLGQLQAVLGGNAIEMDVVGQAPQ